MNEEISHLAQRRYETSPFRTTLRTWPELTPTEQQPWIALATREWLTPPRRRG